MADNTENKNFNKLNETLLRLEARVARIEEYLRLPSEVKHDKVSRKTKTAINNIPTISHLA